MTSTPAAPRVRLRASGTTISGETSGDFLKAKIRQGSTLSIVSAYFTIYAFAALKEQLNGISSLRFLFGEPRFIKSLDPERSDKKAFRIEDDTLQLTNRLRQKCIAGECAEWMRNKVEVRSVKQSNLLHGKMYHIAHNDVEDAIMGSSNFTVRGLGLAAGGNNIELNLEVDSNRDRRDLKAWFDGLWNDSDLVEDVKEDVLLYLGQLYQNHAPEFVYYKTLFHIFERFLDDQARADLLSEKSQIVDTDIWNTLFEFQKDGVKGAINKILRHNGCIIADSVGLGKTYEALEHRRLTGRGQHIDLSELEATVSLLDTAVLDYTVNGREAAPSGNRSLHRPSAPHGVYPCLGEDRWCAIAVFTDEEWLALCRVIGEPEWAREGRFATLESRLRNVGELDRLIGEWT